jgi:hypothetical protein
VTAQQRAAEILRLYLSLPDTPHRPRPADRKLARTLADQDLDLDLLHSAMLLASARRRRRSHHLPPLAPIRALAYFLPVLDELQQHPPLDPGYCLYLQRLLR